MKSINPNVFTFFNALKQNNERTWFETHKAEFKALEAEVKAFASELENGLSASDSIEKTKLFRIYRDVRFSKDKTPYKTYFGMALHREKPALRGGYYLHLETGNSFIGVGFWGPSKEDLFRIRQELAVDASELRELMEEPHLKSVWGPLQGDEVKTAPKGFSKEHADIDLIKKKQYVFIKKFSDQEVVSDTFLTTILDAFVNIRPFFDYMSMVLTTDSNGVSLIDS